MLRAYVPLVVPAVDPTATRWVAVDPAQAAALPDGACWLDLLNPTGAEEALVEQALGLLVPTREEMQEIEPSSRLYAEDGALFMTAPVLHHADTDEPESTPVTFVLAGQRLVTIRYAEPRSLATFAAHAERQPALAASGPTALLGLLEAIVDRTADVLERVGGDLDALSKEVFGIGTHGRARRSTANTHDFEGVLRRLGLAQDVTNKARDSLVGLSRMVGFLALPTDGKAARELRVRLKSLGRDVLSLTDHATYLSGQISFLMEATLGLVGIQQNQIIKLFSVAAVVFLPPTLVASIYGMNFKTMPELEWLFGYPFAIGLMVVSAIVPYLFFKRKGWL